jgi:hypothetical protein
MRTFVTTLLPFVPDQVVRDQAASLPVASDATVKAALDPVTGLLAGVVERLYADYSYWLPLSAVVDVVAGCVHDIQATPAEALPELTERLARHRLAEFGFRPGS